MQIGQHLALAVIGVALISPATSAFGAGTGIVSSIVKAPVVPDGNVSGAATDIVVNLNGSHAPDVPGRALLAGKKIYIYLPDAFVDSGSLPVATPFTPGCVPGSLATLTCNTIALLQGFPQHPFGFPPPAIPGKWQVSSGGPNVLVVEALQDLMPNPPLEPGLKQIHLLLFGYVNPRPGIYEIGVAAETGPAGALETGSGRVQILPQPMPSINVAGAFNVGAPNTIYQETGPGQLTPLNYDFLVWDQHGLPMTGVEISNGLLVQDGRAVGQVSIEAPAGATGQEIASTAASFAVPAVITGVPTARLTVQFRAGSRAGRYVVRFHMAGGNRIAMFVDVVR